jgi:hypothetical protein
LRLIGVRQQAYVFADILKAANPSINEDQQRKTRKALAGVFVWRQVAESYQRVRRLRRELEAAIGER